MITLQERVHGTPTPDGWTLNKLHRVFRVRKGHKNIEMREDNLLSLSYGRIVQKDIDSADGLLPESFETYQIVEPGNIVMRLTDLQNDKRSLRQGLVKERGIITSAYDALELEKGHDPRFWAYALLALDLAKYYYSLGGGVRQSIKFADFPNDWVAVPKEEEQSKIADYLDYELNRIAELILKKKTQIGLLNERLDVFRRRTLQGITGDASQPVNFPDIAAVPMHWRKTTLQRAIMVSSGDFLTADSFLDEGVPVFGGNGHRGYYNRANTQAGTVLVGRYGALCGNVHVVDEPVWATEHAFRVRLLMKVSPKFIAEWIRALELRHVATRAAQPGLNSRMVRENPLALPSFDEQCRISERIQRATQANAKLTSAIEKSIKKLDKYRTSLITAFVTGETRLSGLAGRKSADQNLDEMREARGA